MKLVTHLKKELKENLEKIQTSITIVTGFVTKEAFQFVEEIIDHKVIKKEIIFKYNIYDFINGSSSFDFKYAYEKGWKVYLDNSIHAKNYIFDNRTVIQGSANLTANGIGLFHLKEDDNNILYDYDPQLDNWIQDKKKRTFYLDEFETNYFDNLLSRAMKEDDDEIIFTMQQEVHNKLISARYKRYSNNYDKTKNNRALSKDIFIKAFKKSPNNFAQKLTLNEINKKFRVEENSVIFQQFVIEIDILERVSFDFSYPLYRHIPKIYKSNGVYYIEKSNCFITLIDSNIIKEIIQTIQYLYDKKVIPRIHNNQVFKKKLFDKTYIYFPNYVLDAGFDKDIVENYFKDKLLLIMPNQSRIINEFRLNSKDNC